MEQEKANIESAKPAPEVAGPKEWLSVALNAAVGSAFAVLVFYALLESPRWGWKRLAVFLLTVLLMTLVDMRIMEPLAHLLHVKFEPERLGRAKVSLRHLIVIAIVFTTLMEAFNKFIERGGEGLEDVMAGGLQDVGGGMGMILGGVEAITGQFQISGAGFKIAFGAFIAAILMVGTITFCWAWGASLRPRRAALFGLLSGILVGIGGASFDLFMFSKSLNPANVSTAQILIGFTYHVLMWAVPGFVGGLMISSLSSRNHFLWFIVYIPLLALLPQAIYWLLFRSSMYVNIIFDFATNHATWLVAAKSVGWGVGVLTCAQSERVFVAPAGTKLRRRRRAELSPQPFTAPSDSPRTR